MTKYMFINVPEYVAGKRKSADKAWGVPRTFNSPLDRNKVIWKRSLSLFGLVKEANGELGNDVSDSSYALATKLNTMPFLYCFKFCGTLKDFQAWVAEHADHHHTIIDTGKRTLIQHLKEQYMKP